ncbi:ABC transporter ATP-binding protein [Trichloromonas sp.]|uniref:ABC transporter ATP-binding protein n=1 Tax=Trichloromonas sp. TaxID=3069249 RepID=UPI002A380A56|nr:ABC transporter ATP-binding protein [Trichloromonas sp.]
MLECSQLRVCYQEGEHALLAIDRVDLRLEPGRVLALVGESGSGKTTLARSLLGLAAKNARIDGALHLDGEDLTHLSEGDWNRVRWRRIAMVGQNGAAALNPVLSVGAQVAEPLIVHRGLGAGEALAQARTALAAMGLEPGLARHYPHELSGGQIQRALLAMALILDPQVLILDEPTAALDPPARKFVGEVIREQRRRGKAILLISHDLDSCRRLADTVAVLYLGRIFEELPAQDLFAAPRHPYTQALVRSYPRIDAVRDLGGMRGDAFYRMVHVHDRQAAEHAHTIGSDDPRETGHAPEQGCLFAPRCTQAQPACREEEPELLPVGEHLLRCRRGGIVNLLELYGVRKSYAHVTALAPVDLQLRQGEVFGLVGETGSGKSTLAMIAAGALAPDSGKCLFAGREMEDWLRQEQTALARQVGIVQQHPALAVSPRLDVFEIVAEPLRIQKTAGMPESLRERVARALAEVHLPNAPEFLRRFPQQLNQGTLQRLCIARALITEPLLLVADEPTSALDPSVQAKVMRLLLDLQIEKGLTLLLVTHDLGLARKVSDRIGVMHAGNLVEVGNAAQVWQHPGHPYTRELLNASFDLGDSDELHL